MQRIIAAALIAAACPAAAGDGATPDAGGKVELGYLACELLSDDGNVVVSEQQFACAFSPAGADRPDERYIATFSKFGIDLSKTEAETIRWLVLASADRFEPGLLVGRYVGVAADIALGKGVGARALVGGLHDSVTLQPLSLSTQDGIGVSLAFESMELTHVDTDG